MITNSKNIVWINNLKAICIILVYFRHCEAYLGVSWESFNSFVEPIYVNAFFFVSGYLFFRKQLSDNEINIGLRNYIKSGAGRVISNLFFRIAIPSTIFAIIEFLPKKIMRGAGLNVSEFLVETVGGCTFWFTSALLVSQILLLVLLFTRNKNIWFYFSSSILLAIAGHYISESHFSIIEGNNAFPWLYKQGMIATIYLALGGLYWHYEELINKYLKFPIILIGLLAIYIVGSSKFFLPYVQSTTSLCSINVLGVLVSCIGTFLLIELCKRISDVKALDNIGKNSIGFYFLSGALPALTSIIINKIVPNITASILIADFILCIMSAYIIVTILTKYMSFIFDLRQLKSR